jgi:hypothetical protein
MHVIRRKQRTCGWLLMLAVAAYAPVGCGGATDNLPREPISGTVRFNDQPLNSGSIQFMPVESKDKVSSGGMIVDGSFRVNRDVGPVPGKYTVMIFAGGSPATAASPGRVSKAGTKPAEQPPMGVGLIPLRYNLKTELTAEVTAGGPNHYTFDLKP